MREFLTGLVAVLLAAGVAAGADQAALAAIDGLLEAGRYAPAQQQLEALRAKAGDDCQRARIDWRLGVIAVQQEQLEQALEAFAQALKCQSWETPDEQLLAALAYSNLLIEERELTQAGEVLQQVIEAGLPATASAALTDLQLRVLLNYAALLSHQGHHEQALGQYLRALGGATTSQRVQLLPRTIAAAQQQGAPGAIWVWLLQLALAPEIPPQITALVLEAMRDEGLREEVLAQLPRALEAWPELLLEDLPRWREALGAWGQWDGLVAGLVSQYEQQGKPGIGRVLVGLYVQSGSTEQALELAERVFPEDRQVWLGLLEQFQLQDDLVAAASAGERLSRLDPAGGYEEMLGRLLLSAGLADQARDAWLRGLARQTSDLRRMQNIIGLLARAGFVSEAVAACRQVRERTGLKELFAATMVNLYLRQGETVAMLEEYQRAASTPDARQQFRYELEQAPDSQLAGRLRALLDDPQALDQALVPTACEFYLDLLLAQRQFGTATRWLVALPEHLRTHLPAADWQWEQLAVLAQEALQAGALEDAVDVAYALRAASPEYLALLPVRALAESRLGRWPASIRSWRESLALQLPAPAGSMTGQAAEQCLQLAQALVADHSPGAALQELEAIPVSQLRSAERSLFSLVRGQALSQLKQIEAATAELLEASQSPRYRAAALLTMGDVALWQGDSAGAQAHWHGVLELAPGGELAPEALARLRWLSVLGEELLGAYALAQYYEWAGAWPEAEEAWRQLAAQLGRSDEAGRCLLRVAQLAARQGQTEEALRELEFAGGWVTDQTLAAELALLRQQLQPPEDGRSFWEEFILAHPETLAADVARRQLEHRPVEAETGVSMP